MDLNEQFATHLKRVLSDDPEMADEVLQDRSTLRSWIGDLVRQQTDSDEMAPVVKRFVRANLSAAAVLRHFAIHSRGDGSI